MNLSKQDDCSLKKDNSIKNIKSLNISFSPNKFLTFIIKLTYLFFLVEFSFIKKINSNPIINIDNNDKTITYSSYLQNSSLGYILYKENQPKNITDDLSNTGIQYKLTSSFIKLRQKAEIELVPKTPYSILNSVYIQRQNNNLTYLKDYLIRFNVDDSVIPYNAFHTEGISNSSNKENNNYDISDFDNLDDDNDNINNNNNGDDKKFFNKRKYDNRKGKIENDMEKKIRKMDVFCDYINQGILFDTQDFSSGVNFTKLENIWGLNFALTKEKKIVRLLFKNDESTDPYFITKNITEDIFEEKNNSNFIPINQRNFDDFYLVNQLYETGTFIFGLSGNLLSVYNITYWDYKGNYLVKLFAELNLLNILKVNNVVFNPNFQNNTDNNNQVIPSITKFGTYKDSIIISTLDKGLIFIEKDLTTKLWQSKYISSLNFNNKNVPLRIKDMSINNNTIYIICENLGMKIFNLNLRNFTDFEFSHPYLIKFDSVFSEKINTPYYGILVDNSIPYVNEFFIELKIKNQEELKPEINRIFITENKSFPNNYNLQQSYKNGLQMFTNQINLGIIYDKLNENILLLSRGVPNFVEVYHYKIDLKNFFQNPNYTNDLNNNDTENNSNDNNTDISIAKPDINSQIFVFSTDSNVFNPAILVTYSESQTYLITNINHSNITFTCEFGNDGDFQMNFIYRTVCISNLFSANSYDNYSSCPLFLTIPMQVQGGVNIVMWVIIGVIVVLLIGLVVFIICCFRGKSNPRNVKDDRNIKYSQQDNLSSQREKNNEVIEVQIIDDIK